MVRFPYARFYKEECMKNWKWKQKIGPADCYYLTRWVFTFYFFSIRIHHWLHSDDLRYHHDHPWYFLTFIIKGGYTDISPDGDDVVSAGSVRLRSPYHKHSVKVNDGGCWSVMLTGPEIRTWGFWVNGKFRKRNKYFYEHGHHNPCE